MKNYIDLYLSLENNKMYEHHSLCKLEMYPFIFFIYFTKCDDFFLSILPFFGFFWILGFFIGAITILQDLKYTITIRLSGSAPLQF